MNNFTIKSISIIAAVVVAAIVGLVVLSSSFKIVDSGSVGILSTWGKVEEQTLSPGPHFVYPIAQSVRAISTQMKAFPSEAHSASHDLQQVGCVVTLQHAINPPMVTKAFVAIGDLSVIDAVVITPAIQETVKSVTSRYTAEELITKRETVKGQIKVELIEFIQDTLNAKGIKDSIVIANVAITDFNFSKEFNDAIESKVKAEQLALQAENEKRQQVTKAEANKAEKQLAADGEAYTTKVKADAAAYQTTVESKARAAAIEREADALKNNPNLIQLRAVERWTGQLPTTNFSKDGAVPFINIK